jgi:fibronectin type 3 domain-containing protein
MCNLSINIYARVPSQVRIREDQCKALDGGIELVWYKISDATSYIVKRADTRQGEYKIIADNIINSDNYYITYKDTGLENTKTYYYKVIARNSEGVGKESVIYEGTPSKSNYLWYEKYGENARIYDLVIYDLDNKRINYNYLPCTTDDYYVKHIGLKLEPHSGIKKIIMYGEQYSPIKIYVYETIDDISNLIHNNEEIDDIKDIIEEKGSEVEFIGKTNFEICCYRKEYIIYRSELKAKGDDKKVILNWKKNDDIDSYSIKKSEDKNGPFTNIVTNLKTNEYVDKDLDNQKTYYYKLEGYSYNNDIIDLGTVHATTTKDRFVILELFENHEEDSDDVKCTELEILDSRGNKIDYNIAQVGTYCGSDYDPIKCIGVYPYHRLDMLKDGKLSEDLWRELYRFVGILGKKDAWSRTAFILAENTGVEKINFWTGVRFKPKKITFYKTSSYEYTENLRHRKNDNLSFFAEKNVVNDNKVTKYEFTQTQPNVPDGIVAISQDNQLKIKWNKVDNADSYQIKRSTSPGGPYTLVEKDIVDLEYIDTGVINGTEYYYVVSAVNKGGESSNSQEVSSIPSAKLPQAPTTLTTIAEKNSIKLSWKAVYNAQNYTVKRSETPGGTYQTIVDNIIDPSYTDTGISFGKTYYYVVTANNAIGVSNNSEEVQGTPGRQKPENPTNIITKVKNNNVYLTWDTSLNAVSYKVLRSESEDGEYKLLRESIKGISYKDSTVEENKTYYYQIIAVNEQGESEETQSVRVVVKHNIEQQALLSITLKNGTTKEYLLTQSQLSEFMDWYEQKTKGKGLPYFTILGKNKYGAYKIVKNYLLFNSISSIDIKEIRQN